MARRLKAIVKTAFYGFSKVLFTAILWPTFRVSVHGRANVPRAGAFLLAANHHSYADPLVLGAFLPRRLWFVMAEDQFEKPIVHGWSRLMDVIPVKGREGFQLAAARKVLETLRARHGVAIFPEGQRSKSGQLLPPHPGIGVFALRSGAPVLPVAIVGTREAYPPGRRFPRPGRVRMYVGPLLTDLKGLLPEEIAEKAMAAISRLLVENGHGDYVEQGCGMGDEG